MDGRLGRYVSGLIAVAILSVSIALVLDSSFRPSVGLYDEGFSLTNALRITRGDVPHLDYWATYPPGTAYVQAMAFVLFDSTLAVARVVNAFWGLLIVLSSYLLLRRAQSLPVAATGALLVAYWFAAALPPSYSGIPAIAVILLTFLLLLSSLEVQKAGVAIAAGVVGGLGVVFRHDFAFYALVAATVVLIAEHFGAKARTNATPFLVSYALVSGALLAGLVALAGFENLFDQLVYFPATGMREHRLLPIPGIFDIASTFDPRWLLSYVPPFLVVAGAVIGVRTGIWQDPVRRRIALFFGTMSLLLTVQARNRLDLPHAAPSVIFAIVFLLAVVRSATYRKRVLANRIVLAGALLALVGFTVVVLWYSYGRDIRDLDCALPATSRCMVADADQAKVIGYVQEHTVPDDFVFVGNTAHDQIYVNDASLYFLLQRNIPVRWNEMHPGVVTTREVQEKMVESLELHRVRYAVLVDMPRSIEPNKSAVSSNVHLLDEYLRQTYRPVYSSGRYLVVESNRTTK